MAFCKTDSTLLGRAKRQARAVPLILKTEDMAVSGKDIEILWKWYTGQGYSGCGSAAI